MTDHRIRDQNRNRINYSCDNRRFMTNLQKGQRHGCSPSLGAVFGRPLASSDEGFSLWLEYVVEKRTNADYYWLMWYNADGWPTIPASGVLTRRDILDIVERLVVLP